ncbi:hypothetical protein [Loktanella sp. SALINAS62]|nr:hypothetical protein [Loktanella sp. SALINAS62]
MQFLKQGYKSVGTLASLNWDRVLMCATMIVALFIGGQVAMM